MGLFKSKKSSNTARQPPSLPIIIREAAEDDNESSIPKGVTKKKFPLLLLKRKNNGMKQQYRQPVFCNDPTTVDLLPVVFKKKEEEGVHFYDYEVDDDKEEEMDLGDIPRSISTPSRDILDPLPPLPPTPKDDEEERLKQIWQQMQRYQQQQQNKTPEFNNELMLEKEEECNHDEDSIGSPCEFIIKRQQLHRQRLEQMSRMIPTEVVVDSARPSSPPDADACQETDNIYKDSKEGFDTDSLNNNGSLNHNTATDKLQAIITEQPSIEYLQSYISALSPTMSPDTSAELPSRALGCLFTLSEVERTTSSVDTQQQQQRVHMVHGLNHNNTNNNSTNTTTPQASFTSLIPALLSFLQRCPQNSSEQYLTLLVLNNLSIPMQNKRSIALQYDGASILARLLCEDPGCHVLVIIIVNLTFGDLELNRDLLMMGNSSLAGCTNSRQDGWNEVQLVQSLGYVLLVSTYSIQFRAMSKVSLPVPHTHT